MSRGMGKQKSSALAALARAALPWRAAFRETPPVGSRRKRLVRLGASYRMRGRPNGRGSVVQVRHKKGFSASAPPSR
jgi:hypothetical protein